MDDHIKSGSQNNKIIEHNTQVSDTKCVKSDMEENNSPAHNRKSSERHKLSYEEILQQLEERIPNLLKREDFFTSEARIDLKFVQRQTRYSPDVLLNKKVVERIVRLGIAHVFLKVWQNISTVDYLNPEKAVCFRNLTTAISIIWNCSDKSTQLCECLVKTGVIQMLLNELATPKLEKSDLKDDNTLYLVKGYLGILHNIVQLCSDSRSLFRSSNAVNILRSYLLSSQPLVKSKAYFILAYVITEDENEMIDATDENIEFIIHILREALNSENHFSKRYAFWAREIACGLNRLAVNDANKAKICRLGALPLYVKLLQSNIMEEQSLSTAGLWILAFKDENKRLIQDEPECMEALQNLATHNSHEGIRRAARGALWVIGAVQERSPPQVQLASANVNTPHVMISYNWASKAIMMRVKHRLRAAGYKVWMDIDNMSGSTLEAMALAVERAAVVLICMSQAYKDSSSCRTEAEYTYRLQKDIIPLLLQPGYVPDGWLGMLAGTKLYFDFSDERSVDIYIPKLVKELGTRGRLTTAHRDQRDHLDSGQNFQLNASLSMTSLHSYSSQTSVSSWSTEDIRNWLRNHGLINAVEQFGLFSGELLSQYKKMQRTAPEFFYNSLKTDLGFDLITILKFTKALEEIM